jgi:hypothetical protein
LRDHRRRSCFQGKVLTAAIDESDDCKPAEAVLFNNCGNYTLNLPVSAALKKRTYFQDVIQRRGPKILARTAGEKYAEQCAIGSLICPPIY